MRDAGIDISNPIADHPLNRGQVVRWLPLPNNSGGQTLWDLATRNHGTLTNSPAWSVGPNRFSALTFNASSQTQRVESLATGLPTGASDEFTIVYGHYTNSYVSLSVDFGFGSQLPAGGGAGDMRYSLEFNNNYYLWGGTADWDTGVAYVTGRWVRIAFTNRGGNLYLYKDGVQAATRVGLPSFSTAGSYVTLGSCHSGAASCPNASFSDGIIYARSFSDADAWNDYSEWRTAYPNTLRRWRRRIAPSEQAAGATFQSAWARGANSVLCPGAA